MNSTGRLVYMANQIALNLAHEPDPAAAVTQHIKLYWDPAMKTGIRAVLAAGAGELSAAAAAAVAALD